MLVLLLLGVSATIVLPNIDKGLRDREARIAALNLAAVARDLRSRALSEGVPQALALNVPQNSYLVGKSRDVRLPADVRFVSIEGGEPTERDVRTFYFFPNGSTLGGTIVLGAEASAAYRIRVEALTGRVEVGRADPS